MIQSFTEKLHCSLRGNEALTIVCLGDSVTYGAFGNGCVDQDAAYGKKLERMFKFFFPDKEINVINSGIGGTTAQFAVGRLERDVLAYNPDLVLVMFGVNDFGDIDAYGKALERIFARMKEENIPTVYATEHMMNTYTAKCTADEHLEYAAVTAAVQTNGTMDRVYALGREVAEKYGVAVCDIYKRWKTLNAHGVDTTALLSNGINHPCPEMHTLLAYEILSTILF